jgi:hypothetical protein
MLAPMRIRQIVFAAHDLAAKRSLLGQLLDLPAPFRDPGVAEFGIDNAVFCLGDQFIEVVSPKQPGTACGRHLARQGDSGYMLLLQTDDLDREMQRFAALGVRNVWHCNFDDIRAMHLHPKDVGGAIVSIDQPTPAAAWRWGGPDWQVQPGAAGRQRVRGVTLQSPDPQALAARWALVLGLAAPVAHGEGWRLALAEGATIDMLPAAGGHEGLVGFQLAVADPDAVLARARAAGLAVQGGQATLMGVRLQIEALAAVG